jgi:hypothetical protein
MIKIYSTLISPLAKSYKTLAAMSGLLLMCMDAKAQYCSSVANLTADDEIFNVTFGTLNNTSVCGAVAPGPGSQAFKYSNYTTLAPTNYVAGNNYPFSVTGGQCGSFAYSCIIGAWIDYNQNGLFTDPGEEIFMSPYTSFAVAGTIVSATGGITIPVGATPGLTRMRVIMYESSTNPGPCTNPGYGETEDYQVNIVPSIPFNIGVSALVKPTNLKKCFGIDTIVARVSNSGTVTANFAVTPATITVISTGVINATYTLAVNSGSIPTFGSQDYTITTNYNMNVAGNYNLKGYTTAAGDGYAPDDTTIVTIQRKPFFDLSLTPNDTVCLGVPVIVNNSLNPIYRLGTGDQSNTATSYPAPYGNTFHGAKHQFLVLASELTAAGLTPGNITSVSFNAVNLNSAAPIDGFNIGIATTTLTNLTGFEGGIPGAFTAATYTPVLGINRHVLTTPFAWNGTSNLIVETCFNNYQQSNTTSSNVSFSSSNTPFSSSVWYAAGSVSSLCSNTTAVTGTANNRPDIYFDQPVTVTYSWNPTVGVSASSVPSPTLTPQVSTTYTLTSSYLGCTSREVVHIQLKPTPLPNLGSDSLVCSVPLTLSPHITGSSYLWNTNFVSQTISITGPGKYWVRVTGANGCSGTDTVRITQGVSPVVTLGPDTGYCQGSSIVLYAGNPGSSYLWSTGATASSITVSSPGTYSVMVTHPSSCKKSDVVNIVTKPLPTVGLTFINPDIFCPTDNGRPLTEGTPSGGTYIGSGITGNIFNATGAGQGTYVILYNYTGPNGCSNIAKDTLRVYACVGVDELENELGLNVYPNPNNGTFTIEVSTGKEIDARIQIITIDGRLVYNDMISGNGVMTKAIDIAELANGIYYLKLETKDAVRTYKVLKQ